MAPTARIAPGVVLVRTPGQGLAVRTADGEFLRIDTGDVPPEALVAHLTSGRGEAGADPGLDRLARAFEEAGYAGDAASAPPLAGHTVHVLGDGRLTGPLTRCVRDAGGDVRTAGPASVRALLADRRGQRERQAVVWCLADPVPDGLWAEADRLPAHGVGWLRCHREGRQVWLEPLSAAPGDVTSEHVRLRRLAATAAHRELAAYWAGHGTPDTGPAHTEASAALTAALLCADLVAWASGAPLVVRRRLRRVDLRDLAVTTHPVLPVPHAAPLPSLSPSPSPSPSRSTAP
ncbi:hypothetical protein [Streptomyces boncukensis]|uniref:Uncharacterized protein n=1 Tax=Streptomyces boncukensis TaxID=2711219 RepID=A0A6G4X6Q7_9ACTN|nr:hypothetical protein [Streptomyces boncukensis]